MLFCLFACLVCEHAACTSLLALICTHVRIQYMLLELISMRDKHNATRRSMPHTHTGGGVQARIRLLCSPRVGEPHSTRLHKHRIQDAGNTPAAPALRNGGDSNPNQQGRELSRAT